MYAEVLAELGQAGAEWVQIDEPVLVEDRTAAELEALERAYTRLGGVEGAPEDRGRTYFDHVGEAYPVLARLPVAGVALDFVRGAAEPRAGRASTAGRRARRCSRASSTAATSGSTTSVRSLELLEELRRQAGDNLVVSTSCSLQHSPIDKRNEPRLDDEVLSWMSFAVQKLDEVAALDARAERGRGRDLRGSSTRTARRSRTASNSPRTRNPQVRERLAQVTDADASRAERVRRRAATRSTSGSGCRCSRPRRSAPSRRPRRSARRACGCARARSTRPQYLELMQGEVERVIRLQEDIGLDVLVHGEPERNDMVQYFAEQMDGYVFTENAWVQSYGSRYVRPPIIFGDVSRPNAMTVEWTKYAQSLTDKHVKGMLTGPVTMLMWSFVRDDQPRSETCKQLALAIRDEVSDLEAAGVDIIQVDEPAIREGLPLRSRPLGRVPRLGGVHASACRSSSCATRPRSRRTCVTPSSATSCARSRRWTPTCC